MTPEERRAAEDRLIAAMQADANAIFDRHEREARAQDRAEVHAPRAERRSHGRSRLSDVS